MNSRHSLRILRKRRKLPRLDGLKRCNHTSRIALLDSSLDVEPGTYTYPPESKVINGRHFYQNTVVMDWAKRSARPVSLRQLAFFGRRLTTDKIINSGNFVREELPIRIAHRIRSMQILPFAVISNPHLCQVYQQYYTAFDLFRKLPVITSLEDNDRFCELLGNLLDEHLSTIPQLVMGVIETAQADIVDPDRLDEFMNTILRSRISRRVIAEQHLSLSRAFRSNILHNECDPSYIGEVFLQCSARDTVVECAKLAQKLTQELYPGQVLPKVEIEGHIDTTFPYIKSHLDYIIGEILRNSFEATMKAHLASPTTKTARPPPILVSISNSEQSVLLRISDQGAGIPQEILPHIWSFAKGPRSEDRLQNFKKVPLFVGLAGEVATTGEVVVHTTEKSSLGSLSRRSPRLKLGMGLPMSRVYAEYWDGALDLQSIEGYGTDVFLRISRLGNQNERLNIDAV